MLAFERNGRTCERLVPDADLARAQTQSIGFITSLFRVLVFVAQRRHVDSIEFADWHVDLPVDRHSVDEVHLALRRTPAVLLLVSVWRRLHLCAARADDSVQLVGEEIARRSSRVLDPVCGVGMDLAFALTAA